MANKEEWSLNDLIDNLLNMRAKHPDAATATVYVADCEVSGIEYEDGNVCVVLR